MPRKKLLKLNELALLPNVFEISEDIANKLNFYFANSNPHILEIGCGEGDYTTFLAEQNTYANYIGIDLAGQRIWTGSKKSLENKIANAAFIHGNILNLRNFLPEKSISEIWLPFPGPQRKKKFSHRILLAPQFLTIYKSLLIDGGIVHVKTDSDILLDFALANIAEFNTKIIEFDEDIYSSIISENPKFHKTKYEKSHLAEGKKIKHLSFHFD